MHQKTLWAAGALGLGFLLVMLASACSREALDLPTGSTALTSSSEMSRVSSQASNGNENDNENEADNDNDNDNTNGGNAGPGGEEGGRLRGLLFAFEGACTGRITLVMKQGSAVVDEDTRLESEVAGVEGALTPGAFCALLRPGLPLRVTLRPGSGQPPFAARVRIDDEIDATGVIDVGRDVVRRTGTFSLTVNGLGTPIVIPFTLAPDAELDPFEAGDRVRVEGTVLSDLSFAATEIQFDN